MSKPLTKREAVAVSSRIKTFERVYNGIEDALIDVGEIRKEEDGFHCVITVYEDDFSSKTVYQDILYPLK